MFSSYQNQAALFNRLKNEMIGLYAKVDAQPLMSLPARASEDPCARSNDPLAEPRSILTGQRKCFTQSVDYTDRFSPLERVDIRLESRLAQTSSGQGDRAEGRDSMVAVSASSFSNTRE